MELRFVAPDLRQLDLLVTEILAVPVAAFERPPQGTAGLIDYRLGGRISHLIANGEFSGELGEMTLLSVRPKLSIDKVLLFGTGENDAFNPQIYGALVERLLQSLQEMGSRRAIVELPGRANNLITPELATEILLELSSGNPWFDTWTLIESPVAQRSISALIQRDQRKQWGVTS